MALTDRAAALPARPGTPGQHAVRAGVQTGQQALQVRAEAGRRGAGRHFRVVVGRGANGGLHRGKGGFNRQRRWRIAPAPGQRLAVDGHEAPSRNCGRPREANTGVRPSACSRTPWRSSSSHRLPGSAAHAPSAVRSGAAEPSAVKGLCSTVDAQALTALKGALVLIN